MGKLLLKSLILLPQIRMKFYEEIKSLISKKNFVSHYEEIKAQKQSQQVKKISLVLFLPESNVRW